jgi:hypothetical protein
MFVLRFICTIYTFFFSLFFFLYCMYFEEATLSDCDILLFEKAVKSLTFIKLYYLRKYIFKKNSLAARSINDNCDFRPYDSTIFVHTIQPFSSIRFIESNMQRGKGCFLPYGSGRSDASFTCQVQMGTACTCVKNKNHYRLCRRLFLSDLPLPYGKLWAKYETCSIQPKEKPIRTGVVSVYDLSTIKTSSIL